MTAEPAVNAENYSLLTVGETFSNHNAADKVLSASSAVHNSPVIRAEPKKRGSQRLPLFIQA